MIGIAFPENQKKYQVTAPPESIPRRLSILASTLQYHFSSLEYDVLLAAA
jgi:hypothetical protein